MIDETPVGVGIVLANKNGRLIVVQSPPESPAAKAGVREGDVLERIDDVVVSDLIFPLNSGSGALRLATASFLRPNGKNIQRFVGEDDSGDWGVQPDTGFAVASSNDEHDRQLERSLACLRGQLKSEQDRVPTDGQKTTSDDSAAIDSVWRRFGMRLEEIKLEDFRRISSRYRGGMKVVAVRAEGPAAREGIREGDILVGIHVWETVNIDNLNYILGSDVVRENETARFYVLRNEEIMFGEISPER
jgi:serine protease Do